jgi:hypothetical protein
MPPTNRIEIGMFGAAKLYAVVLVSNKTITVFDTLALTALWGLVQPLG